MYMYMSLTIYLLHTHSHTYRFASTIYIQTYKLYMLIKCIANRNRTRITSYCSACIHGWCLLTAAFVVPFNNSAMCHANIKRI